MTGGAGGAAWRDAGAGLPLPATEADAARSYAAYRRRQAARLVRLMPREALRPLYRRAAAWLASRGEHPGADPLAALVRFCDEALLPLPPPDVWRADLRRNPDAYFEDVGAGAAAAGGEPEVLDVRPLRQGGASWEARLEGRADAGGWRGAIAFHSHRGDRCYRTTEVFHAEDPLALRDRFRTFDEAALEAFLRSCTP